jgi:hypothetical protein
MGSSMLPFNQLYVSVKYRETCPIHFFPTNSLRIIFTSYETSIALQTGLCGHVHFQVDNFFGGPLEAYANCLWARS